MYFVRHKLIVLQAYTVNQQQWGANDNVLWKYPTIMTKTLVLALADVVWIKVMFEVSFSKIKQLHVTVMTMKLKKEQGRRK